MKHLLRLSAPLLLQLIIGNLRAQQETDSSTTAQSNEIFDLAQNRLFMMSTGRTMPAKQFSAGDFEIFLLQLGYAPVDFAHLNFTYILPLGGRSPYWSLGTKIQVLRPSGSFKGLAFGMDVGFFEELFGVSSMYNNSLVSLNVATTVGSDDANFHVNIAQLIPTSNASNADIETPTYVQVGFDAALKRHAGVGGLKFISELFASTGNRGLSGNIVLVGLRACGKSTVADFGWPFGFGRGGAGVSPIPFFSLTFFFEGLYAV